jgi:hypothetical protein
VGLTIHYELRLPEEASRADVRRVLSSLREFALTLPFEFVSAVHSMPAAKPGRRPPGNRRKAWLATWASIIAQPWDEDIPSLAGDVSTAQGFLVNAGRGCESAIVGFLRRGDESGSVREWFWQCSCKTQYASIVSDEHFVRCHTSIVSLLDCAIRSGIEVIVHDETEFWERRDERQLIEEVHRMNQIVASLAGRLADTIGSGHSVQAAIFEHPRFEHLEMGESHEEG